MDSNGMTALMYAATLGQVRAIQQLLELGADIDAKDNDKRTALILAADRGYGNAVKELLDAGADKHIKDSKGETAFDVWQRKWRISDLLRL